MVDRQAVRAGKLRNSIRHCCSALGYGSVVFSERFGDGVYTLEVATKHGTTYTLRDAEPLPDEEWTLALARNYLLGCIRAMLMQRIHGAPRVCVDGVTGVTLIREDATWEL